VPIEQKLFIFHKENVGRGQLLFVLNLHNMKIVLTKIRTSWKKVAFSFARFQTKVIVTVFYFLFFAPLGVTFRLFGWDPLESKVVRLGKGTNWKRVVHGEPDLEAMRRQS